MGTQNNLEQYRSLIILVGCIGFTWAAMHFFLGDFLKALLELFSKGEQFKIWYWGSFIFISVSVFGIVSRQDTQRRAHEATIRMEKKK